MKWIRLIDAGFILFLLLAQFKNEMCTLIYSTLTYHCHGLCWKLCQTRLFDESLLLEVTEVFCQYL